MSVGPNTSAIQSLIAAKISSIAGIVALIAEITANPQPSYLLDGKEVMWGEYLSSLQANQVTEVNALKGLYELQNIDTPFQFQSRAGGWW